MEMRFRRIENVLPRQHFAPVGFGSRRLEKESYSAFGKRLNGFIVNYITHA
jgi:hypothetical protein